MSARGPSVWTGRALQAESDDLEKLVLRKLGAASTRLADDGERSRQRVRDQVALLDPSFLPNTLAEFLVSRSLPKRERRGR
jgi:hypothetical protein